MLLICENDLACTDIPTDEDTVDGIVDTVAGNNVKDGLEDVDNLYDTPIKLERIDSDAELLWSIARVKQFVMASGEPQNFPVSYLHSLQQAVRGQCLRAKMQTSHTHLF